MNIDEKQFRAALDTILSTYARKRIKLEVDSVDHKQGTVVLRLVDKISCPKCVRTAISTKLRHRFKHIKKVEIIRRQ